MTTRRIEGRRIEGELWAGLAVAALAHAGLLAFLMLRPPSVPQAPPVERVSVTLADDVGLTESAPSTAEPGPAMAPSEGEAAPPPAPAPEPAPASPLPSPEPGPVTPPTPLPKVQPKPQPRAVTPVRPATPTKSSAAPPLPRQVAPTRPGARSNAAPPLPRQAASQTRSAAAPRQPAGSTRATPTARPGAKSFSDAFANMGNPARATGTAATPKAALTGPQKAALIGAISREIRPHWRAPEGLEAERLVTYVTFNLNRDGTISGTPTTRQEGITAANRPQAQRHAEQAVRAIRLAAPFDLPVEYYDAWKRVIDFRFDRRLSQ